MTFINRNPGSGTRLWFDHQLHGTRYSDGKNSRLQELCQHPHRMCPPGPSVEKLDVALGLRAAARQFGLSFIPLFHERYDIVFTQEQSGLLSPLLDTLQTGAFRQSVEALTGYETTHTGEQIPL